MKEAKLKKHLINWLISTVSPEVIACEHSYYFFSRRADIIYLDKNGIHAIEIKSRHDNARRLDQQTPHYLSCFNSVTIAFDLEKIDEATTKNKKVGIYSVNPAGHIHIIKKPKLNNRVKKEELLKLLNTYEINKIMAKFSMRTTISSPREKINFLAKSLSKEHIRDLVFTSIKEKYSWTYQTFLNESGRVFNEDDLVILERKSKKIIL